MELTEEEQKWLTDEFWPTPSWLTDKDYKLHLESYEDYFMYRLRVWYIDLESDFRLTLHRKHHEHSFLKYAMHFAHRIVQILQVCREGLEDKRKSKSINHLLNISNNLSLIDSYKIWMYDQAVVARKYQDKRKYIEANHPEIAKTLAPVEVLDSQGQIRAGELRDAYVDLIDAIKWNRIQREITFGLQVERLQLLIRGGLLTIFLVILLSPLFMPGLKGIIPPLIQSFKAPTYINAWMIMTAVTIIGGLGGFFSGLMQVKSNKVGLEEYQESKLKFQLKPVVGGVTASVLFIFLSWQVLPGIEVQSFGSYLLLAFLSGFSERYFLSLLKMDSQKGEVKAEKLKQVEEEKKKSTSSVMNKTPEKVERDDEGISLESSPPRYIPPTMPTHFPAGSYQTSGSGGSKTAYNPEDEENKDEANDA